MYAILISIVDHTKIITPNCFATQFTLRIKYLYFLSYYSLQSYCVKHNKANVHAHMCAHLCFTFIHRCIQNNMMMSFIQIFCTSQKSGSNCAYSSEVALNQFGDVSFWWRLFLRKKWFYLSLGLIKHAKYGKEIVLLFVWRVEKIVLFITRSD